jgi:hypothetical protein
VYCYVDDADLFGHNINTKGIQQKSSHKSIKVGLKVNVGKAI